MKTRQEALDLLHEYTKSENLRKHGLGVEAAMRAYARKFSEDEDIWGMVGLAPRLRLRGASHCG